MKKIAVRILRSRLNLLMVFLIFCILGAIPPHVFAWPSGNVKYYVGYTGLGVAGVKVTLYPINVSTYTNSNGYYYFTTYEGSPTGVIAECSYEGNMSGEVISIPSPSQVYDFRVYPCGIRYIKGNVTGSSGGAGGVVMTLYLDNKAIAHKETDSSGAYEFRVLQKTKTYTITPNKTGYTFSPQGKSVTVSATGTDVTGVNFTISQVTQQQSPTGTTGTFQR